MINALIAKFKSQRVRGQQNILPLKTDSDASESKTKSPATHQDTPRINQKHAAEEPGGEPVPKSTAVEHVLPSSHSPIPVDNSPKTSALPSATHDPTERLSKDDVVKYAPIAISILALAATVAIAAIQTGISSSLRDLSALTNQQALEAKDLSLMSGISVDITEGKVILNNLGTTAVTNAGYWAVHTAGDTYTDYMSQTTPIPGCSSMTFDPSTLPQQPSSLKSVVLAFQVPSGDWWSVSDIGLLEKSPSPEIS